MRKASIFFAGELDPPQPLIMSFIEDMRGEGHAVESICRVLTEHGCQVAARTYRTWRQNNQVVATRTVTDAVIVDALYATRGTPEGLYGRRKMTAHLRRQGLEVAHCTVDRLMRDLGMNGVRRGKKLRTTIPGRDGHRAGDLLDRDFTADAPNTRWVADFTYVRTWAGFVYVGASCDYAQKTDGPIPYVVAAFVPMPRHAGRISVGGHKLAEGSHCWISPLIDLEGFGIGHLVADPRFTRTRGQDRACQFRAVNRIREQLLMQLISSVARHGDRPGIVSVDGSDPPTAQEHPDQA